MTTPNLIIENSVLKVRANVLTTGQQRTYLTAAASASDTTITVENITGFGVDDYVILGAIGSEEAEIVKLHASTAPSGTTITLGSLTRAHSVDTTVQRIAYNQVEFSRATSSGGSKSVLATSNIAVDQEFTVYDDTSNSTGYAYARFKNSTSSTYSQYSDEQSYGSLAYNSVAKIINRVFSKANERSESFITRAEVLDYLWDFIDAVNDMKTRWKHEETASDRSNTTTTGGETFTIPSDAKYSGDKSVYAVYIQGEKPLTYIGQREFVEKVSGTTRSTLASSVSSGATSITLTDATYFGDTGDGYIEGDAFSWTSKSGHVLSGVTGILDHDAGDIVVDSEAINMPTHFTILNGVGHLYPTPDTDYDNRPLVIDYYVRLTHPNTENDLLPMPYVSPAISFCMRNVYDKKEKPTVAKEYGDRFERQMNQIIRRERLGQPQQFMVKE